MKILYIGNKLAKSGRTPTTVDTLSIQFGEFAEVVAVSDKKNPVMRFGEMCVSVFRHRDVDYVIIDTYSTLAYYFAFAVATCCRLLSKKYIPILHGGSLPERLDQSPKMSKLLFGYSFKNISPSGYLKSEFEKRGYCNIDVIPNNIDVSKYKFKERLEYKPHLLWVRSFAEIYNCKMAVEVLKLVLKRYPEATLCMVGPDKDGSMAQTINLAKAYGISNSLKIMGQMNKEDWHKLSEEYDIFISTTNFDNTPVSVIEAMALGLPVVSTDVGGMPYLIDNGIDGYLVEKNNPKMMANMIFNIIQSSEMTLKTTRKARKKAESFGWESVSKLWIKTFGANHD